MTRILPSYIQDAWWEPADASDATVVRDASTGDEVVRVSANGLDTDAALEHARTIGQHSLAPLTFHQRAIVLKQLALALTERKTELYDLSLQAGATANDAWVDIDGGIGVLFTYSSKGRREMPQSTIYLDGAVEPLSKDGSFIARHICTTLPGVAVQINAFNFPVWGSLEKLAPAFLAGMPTLIKPATPTGFIAEHMVRILTESGLLPAGAVQIVNGSARDLLDHLRLGDTVGFTGSASTADALRRHDAVQARGVRFTAETDSINASVLGPDAQPGTPELDAFVRGLVTEMTSKAGQKCTAIRRAIVPTGMSDAVADAVRARIAAKVVVGDPRGEGVTMGPLASIEQRDEVLQQLQRLRDGGGRIVVGGDAGEVRLADGSVSSMRGGMADGGAFVAPTLLAFDDPESDALHSIEAFGPVSSLVEYGSPEQAAELVARGGGSLVTSVASHDAGFVAELTRRIAPHNGRILLLDRDDARASTGHGSPMPTLVHGGPGRAGGGEELGGIRSVLHHMQRTAVQGSPAMLTALTGVWHPGAPASSEAPHPFRKSLAELRIGDRVESEPREVTLDDIEHFAEFTGDTFYAHMDEAAAAANPFFPGRVAHGYLLLSFAAGLFVEPSPGPVLANTGLESLRFMTPVSPGDSISVTLTAKQITPRETEDYGEVRWDARITNQHDETVAQYDLLTHVAKTQA